MAERLKAHAWKACISERVSGVRIPISPPAVSHPLFMRISIWRGSWCLCFLWKRRQGFGGGEGQTGSDHQDDQGLVADLKAAACRPKSWIPDRSCEAFGKQCRRTQLAGRKVSGSRSHKNPDREPAGIVTTATRSRPQARRWLRAYSLCNRSIAAFSATSSIRFFGSPTATLPCPG